MAAQHALSLPFWGIKRLRLRRKNSVQLRVNEVLLRDGCPASCRPGWRQPQRVVAPPSCSAAQSGWPPCSMLPWSMAAADGGGDGALADCGLPLEKEDRIGFRPQHVGGSCSTGCMISNQYAWTASDFHPPNRFTCSKSSVQASIAVARPSSDCGNLPNEKDGLQQPPQDAADQKRFHG